MTRRTQLLSALAQGDAGAPELLAKLSAMHPGWNRQVVRTSLARAIARQLVWVAQLGGRSAAKPRIYTVDKARAITVPVRKPAPPRKHLSKATVEAGVASAVSGRSALECAWGGR